MAGHGNPSQWEQNYPKKTLIATDIESGCSYVCEEHGQIIATFYYKEGLTTLTVVSTAVNG